MTDPCGGDALEHWARGVAPLELIERRLHIADKATALQGILDDPLAACEQAVEDVRAALPGLSLVGASSAADEVAAPLEPPALASSPDILADFVMALHARGVIGEDRFAKVVYIAMTSRVLNRPVSIVAKGPSSAGKSHVTQQVLEFFPPAAYYALSSMSEHALAYSTEPLAHRFLVLYEAAGLEGDFATYLLRCCFARAASATKPSSSSRARAWCRASSSARVRPASS